MKELVGLILITALGFAVIKSITNEARISKLEQTKEITCKLTKKKETLNNEIYLCVGSGR
jgi:hypothetical protein